MVTTLAGGGSAGGIATGQLNGLGSAATFFNPSDVALDSLGTVYVTDYSLGLIRKITPAGANNVMRLH